jgi:outer membrane protein, heavy metal efflux system
MAIMGMRRNMVGRKTQALRRSTFARRTAVPTLHARRLARARATRGTIMRTELLLVTALLAGCASRSVRSDVARVREISQASVLPRVDGDEVEAASHADVRPLLEKPLSADVAVRIALLNNRALRAELRGLGVSRGRLLGAGLIANPVFEVELLPERDSDLELRVEYDISSLVLAPLAAKAAGAELEAARLTVAGEVVRLGYRVRAAYYAVQAAQKRLAVAEQTLDALTAGRDAAAALLAAGNVPALDVSRQIVAYERARIDVARLELALADAREHMQRLLGLHGSETRWTLASDFAEIPEEVESDGDVEQRAISASLDLKAIHSRLEAAGRRTGLARAGAALPEIEVDFHALRANEDHQADSKEWRYGGGVAVGVPLFDRRQGVRRVAEAEFDALLERQQGLAIEIRSYARELSNRVRSTHARARTYASTLVPAQRTVLEQTLLQYNAMQLSVFELLAARRSQLEIELAYVESQREYWDARAQLDALFAGKLVESPATVSTMPSGGGQEAGGH